MYLFFEEDYLLPTTQRKKYKILILSKPLTYVNTKLGLILGNGGTESLWKVDNTDEKITMSDEK